MVPIIFFLLNSVRGNLLVDFSTDMLSTLDINNQLPLFCSTWNRARGLDSATCAGLATDSDYSYCSGGFIRHISNAQAQHWPVCIEYTNRCVVNIHDASTGMYLVYKAQYFRVSIGNVYCIHIWYIEHISNENTCKFRPKIHPTTRANTDSNDSNANQNIY